MRLTARRQRPPLYSNTTKQRVNEQTVPDRYPIPRIEDFHLILGGTNIFSKLDLFKAYYQITIAEEDKPKTAIITPFAF